MQNLKLSLCISIVLLRHEVQVMPHAFFTWQKESVTSNSGRCALVERARSKSWMGLKCNLDKVGKFFVLLELICTN